LTYQSLRENPITLCVVGLLAIAFLSQIVNAPDEIATSIGFSKACVLYLLMVALIDKPQHWDHYLRWLGLVLFGFASLMVLAHEGLIDSTSQASHVAIHAGRENAFGSKTFSDPNDTALILIVGFLISVHIGSTTNKKLLSLFWFVVAGISLDALKITESRAGFLALGVGTATYVWLRWGGKWLLLLACLSPLIVGQIATSRMRDVGAVSEGTGQERVQLWHTALILFERNPVFGIGPDGFTGQVGQASHNSFLQAYAELGFLGGSLFFFAFYAGTVTAWQTVSIQRAQQGAANSNLHLIVALLVAYCVCVFTLNHLYAAESYLIFGLTTASLRIERRACDVVAFPWKGRFMSTFVLSSCLFLAVTYVLAQALVNW
jgi:O-antigen ligase